MQADAADKEEILRYYRQIREDDPDRSCPLAAMTAMVQFVENNKMETISEFHHRIELCSKVLIEAESKHSSIDCAYKLFRRYITLTNMHEVDFERSRQNMIQLGHSWVNKMANARQTIAKLAEPFITNNTILLTHSYSRVVMEVFRKAVEKGRSFKVFVCESQPDKSGLRTAKELREMGVDCTVILDSAVGYIMESVVMVVVGAENLLKNGGIFNKIGTLSIAIAAKKYHRPLYVFAESLKYMEYFPLNQDSIPSDLKFKKADVEEAEEDGLMEDEHPLIDYTPPKYINRLISDIGVLPSHAIGDEMMSVYH
ncbi:translation initiation factor eIF2B subunit alpha-like [Babylonia areolata]|uniref:translation initiation factor eIF2B subunit alpha-like n=1 Tax=Babylonia areolata TaxID=304850 RepID=UPI003FD20995